MDANLKRVFSIINDTINKSNLLSEMDFVEFQDQNGQIQRCVLQETLINKLTEFKQQINQNVLLPAFEELSSIHSSARTDTSPFSSHHSSPASSRRSSTSSTRVITCDIQSEHTHS
jgi:hypothetical protein